MDVLPFLLSPQAEQKSTRGNSLIRDMQERPINIKLNYYFKIKTQETAPLSSTCNGCNSVHAHRTFCFNVTERRRISGSLHFAGLGIITKNLDITCIAEEISMGKLRRLSKLRNVYESYVLMVKGMGLKDMTCKIQIPFDLSQTLKKQPMEKVLNIHLQPTPSRLNYLYISRNVMPYISVTVEKAHFLLYGIRRICGKHTQHLPKKSQIESLFNCNGFDEIYEVPA